MAGRVLQVGKVAPGDLDVCLHCYVVVGILDVVVCIRLQCTASLSSLWCTLKDGQAQSLDPQISWRCAQVCTVASRDL